jgi:hypothetical protein
MYKYWIFNYDESGATADEATWDGSSAVTITFQIGWYEADGSPAGAYKPDNTQWLAFTSIPAARITGTPNTHFADLGAATDYMPTSHIRFRFDDGTTQKDSGWIPIDFKTSPVGFIKLEDTTNSYGITAWIEGLK